MRINDARYKLKTVYLKIIPWQSTSPVKTGPI